MADPESETDLLSLAAERGIHYRKTVAERRVFPLSTAVERLPLLGGPLPETPQNPADVFRLLDEIGSPATVASAGGRYFGFVTGSSLPVTVAANWLAAAWDQNAGLVVVFARTAAGSTSGRSPTLPLLTATLRPSRSSKRRKVPTAPPSRVNPTISA